MVSYSFDTSAILNGRRDLFPPTVFKTLWTNIEQLIDDGQIRSVDVVRDELTKRDDDACTWAKQQTHLFVPLELDIQAETATILSAHPKLVGKGGVRSGADPFVIGLAKARSGTVVTEEKPTGRLNKPHIPDVCAALGIPCLNLVQFVTEQGWHF
jgi:hypothetical protein